MRVGITTCWISNSDVARVFSLRCSVIQLPCPDRRVDADIDDLKSPCTSRAAFEAAVPVRIRDDIDATLTPSVVRLDARSSAQ
jgi:hypothetical protein